VVTGCLGGTACLSCPRTAHECAVSAFWRPTLACLSTRRASQLAHAHTHRVGRRLLGSLLGSGRQLGGSWVVPARQAGWQLGGSWVITTLMSTLMSALLTTPLTTLMTTLMTTLAPNDLSVVSLLSTCKPLARNN
jgi:hypothetical protein